ncbi:MAG: SDR family NAD(P)-dependent oxidoreductase [Williamsia sp.]|nr:SDR family NAD(P)-dependent oxidoreductase [Williamsia sp.]
MNAYALITGAAKGIGRSLAAELAKRNYHLLLADLDGIGLAQTAYNIRERYRVEVRHIELDLAEEGAAAKLKQWSKPYHDQLQIVVNNAGYGLNGQFAHIPSREHMDNIYVNVRAVVEISHAFIPVLQQHPAQAYLLNVGSTTAYQTVPYLNVYAASKAFVLSFTRGLRYELRKSNISVSCLSPGSTDTDFVNRARMGESVRKTAARVNMSPDEVARIAVRGLFRGNSEIIPGWINKLNAWLPSFFPKSLVERIAGNIYEPKEEALLSPSRPLRLYPERFL